MAGMALVKWLDASRTDEEVRSTSTIGTLRDTVGWVLRDDDEGIILAMSEDLNDGERVYERGFYIPRAYVQRVIMLGGQPKPRKEG